MPNINSCLTSDAIIVFTIWLTSRRGTLKVGEDFSKQEIMELADEFIKWNDLDQDFCGCLSMPPRLWFRFTPSLAKIEWAIRKLIHDVSK